MKKMSAREFLRRLIRSKRLRAFFIVSITLHVIFGMGLVFSPKFRNMVFGDPNARPEVKPIDVSEETVLRAIETLTKLYRERYIETIGAMAEARNELNRHQAQKLETLVKEDEDRKVKIANKQWPNAQTPDLKAVYVARVDEKPSAIKLRNLPSTEAMEAMSLVDLYNLHPDLEKEAGRLYERAHAMRLCEPIEDIIPLSQCIKNTSLKMPDRRPINAQIMDTSGIRNSTDGSLEAFRNEVTLAYLETQDMVANVRRWLEMCTGTEASTTTQFGPSLSVVPISVEYYGEFLNPLSLRRVSREQVINPPVELGRHIGASQDSHPAEWVSVSRWYVVGPFTHPGASRRMDDLERKFPPESTVDLDATYQGKDGRQLKWKYRAFGTDFMEGGVRMEPYVVDNCAFAVWYFYTEIRSDKDQNVLASFSSDDYGVCWLNRRRVYQSPPETQPWKPFCLHNFRVLSLRKGINKLLFKLENARGTTGFSMLMMTYEDKELIDAIKARFNLN
jgi:hypothetical protein